MLKNKNTSPMPTIMVITLICGLSGCIIFSVVYSISKLSLFFTLAITFGMIAYHMLIRFISPVLLVLFNHKKYNYKSWWFSLKSWETPLYKALRVKKWKKFVISYNPNEFSTEIYSLEEIVNNMCHAEAVHELIVLFSLASLLFSIPFGSFVAFLVTGLISALCDTIFIIIQRFNRPRIISIIKKQNRV